MKNVWKIFQRDMMRVRNNVIALVVIIGISVVPCLYAWFNIAASWDPYSNTGNLKVAVASADEGYEGSLIPIEINIGDKVLSALRKYPDGVGVYHRGKSYHRSEIRKILCSDRDSEGFQ